MDDTLLNPDLTPELNQMQEREEQLQEQVDLTQLNLVDVEPKSE